MNYASKVLEIALAEVGYLEKKSNKDLYSKTANAGFNNYTKYGYEMHKIYPSIMDYPAYWCDAFVDWCFMKAYGVSNAKGLLGGNFDDYTVASAQLYANKGALDTTPDKGAQVFFTKNGKISGCYHTGLVYACDSKDFYTVEGNTSGANGVIQNGGGVCEKKYSIKAYKGKVLFGHPKYDKEVQPKPTHTTETAKSYSKKLAKTYKVTANSLNMRSGAGTNKDVIAVLKLNEKVVCYGYYTTVDNTKWLYVAYGKLVGFVSSKYLK